MVEEGIGYVTKIIGKSIRFKLLAVVSNPLDILNSKARLPEPSGLRVIES